MAMATSSFRCSSFSRVSSSSRCSRISRSADDECLRRRGSPCLRFPESLRGGDFVCALDGIVAPLNSTLSTSRRDLRPTLRSSQSSQECVDCCNGGEIVCGTARDIGAGTSEKRCSQDVECSFAGSEVTFDSESKRWTRRREVLLAMAMAGVLVPQGDARAEDAEAVDVPSLEPYTDEKEGFKLLRPALWNKVEKAGATVLFEDPAKRGNTVGVVVNPVRISSLKDFGSPDDVAEKLIAAERRKPSTNDAQLVRVQERQARGDTPLYALEYTLDSSRGKKRILSAVTVASRKLYILNITYVDSPATPAPPAVAEAFQQVLDSFDLLN